jgi:hypothetical protein
MGEGRHVAAANSKPGFPHKQKPADDPAMIGAFHHLNSAAGDDIEPPRLMEDRWYQRMPRGCLKICYGGPSNDHCFEICLERWAHPILFLIDNSSLFNIQSNLCLTKFSFSRNAILGCDGFARRTFLFCTRIAM